MTKTKTIDDFSHQWTTYTDNEGYYGSKELFEDIVNPLLNVNDFKGKKVLEVGSGTGRIVNMIMECEPEHIYAVEPSDAFFILKKNTQQHSNDQLTLLHCTGDKIPLDIKIDIIVSIGVVHHIPEPDPVILAAKKSLKPGGKIFVWLYGKENNYFYLFFMSIFRKIVSVLPQKMSHFIAFLLTVVFQPYCYLIKKFNLPLPLAGYLKKVFIPFGFKKQQLVVFDQLNPFYAKYYTKEESRDLLIRNGFKEVKTFHRHEYSWSVLGKK